VHWLQVRKVVFKIKTNKIAGGGICAALCLAFLFGGSFIPAKLAILFITSIIMGVCILRYRGSAAFAAYFAVSVLSVFILPNKLMAWSYAALFGIYPLIKLYIEKMRSIVAEYIAKFIVWNLHLVALYVVLSAFGQNSLMDLGTFWAYFAGIIMLLAYDLVFGICINSLYKTYYKYLK